MKRPRRNRKSEGVRRLVREHSLSADDLIMPLFVVEGRRLKTPVRSMEGISRYSVDLLVRECEQLCKLGIPAVALFPVIEGHLKDKSGSASRNEAGLIPRTVKALKKAVPDLVVITDVAMDPYSSDGHDGLVGKSGEILNDETLPILADMALVQARAGADMVAPSDMMDGRVGFIRKALDKEGFKNTSILAYSAKYASHFYGPFRDALGSAPKKGDKKTYQMDPANVKEALREVALDIEEGADMVMVKPGLPYLDVLRAVCNMSSVPVLAYNVSGEYACLKAAGLKGWISYKDCVLETLLAFKRAGASAILTYHAHEVASWLKAGS